jgi:hypothetical protein
MLTSKFCTRETGKWKLSDGVTRITAPPPPLMLLLLLPQVLMRAAVLHWYHSHSPLPSLLARHISSTAQKLPPVSCRPSHIPCIIHPVEDQNPVLKSLASSSIATALI